MQSKKENNYICLYMCSVYVYIHSSLAAFLSLVQKVPILV